MPCNGNATVSRHTPLVHDCWLACMAAAGEWSKAGTSGVTEVFDRLPDLAHDVTPKLRWHASSGCSRDCIALSTAHWIPAFGLAMAGYPVGPRTSARPGWNAQFGLAVDDFAARVNTATFDFGFSGNLNRASAKLASLATDTAAQAHRPSGPAPTTLSGWRQRHAQPTRANSPEQGLHFGICCYITEHSIANIGCRRTTT